MYSYTYGGKKGKKHKLEVAEDRVAVRTRNARKLKDAISSVEGKEMLGKFDVEMNLPEADVSILQVKEDVRKKKEIRDETRSILKNEPELRFAGRVLVDEESQSPVLYTENLFIKFEDAVEATRCEEILSKYNLRIKQKPDFAKNAYFVSAAEGIGLDIFKLSEEVLALPETELCHPELVRRRAAKDIHPKQWHLKKTLINNKEVDAHANVEAAHAITRGAGIVIAVIDDGVDIDHPEFNIPGKVVGSRDATLGTNDPRPKFWDENHGTSCAGVAVAAGVHASGVAPEAKLMPIRLASALGSFQEAQAFQWAANNGADVISCSWGPTDGDWSDSDDPMHAQDFPLPDSTRLAIEDAIAKGRGGKGCVICWAAGNGRESVDNDGYASFDKVISVAACNDTGHRSVYSDFGKAIWCAFPSGDFEYGKFKQPKPLTTGIYTTDRMGNFGYSGRDYADDFSGTSSATPGVAGVAGLILSANPNLSWSEVKNILRDCCTKIDTADAQYDANGHSVYLGYGRIDAKKALDLALASAEPKPESVELRIMAALVDPPGTDKDNETVTIKNLGTKAVSIAGWSICDGKDRHDDFGQFELAPGQTFVLLLSKVKLANKGSSLSLKNASGKVVHEVSYVESDISPETGEVDF